MNQLDPKAHWEKVYGSKAENEVSWFQDKPTTSLEFIEHCGGGPEVPIVDIGGGESRLVDRLLDAGYRDIAVLDVSENALRHTKKRLNERAALVEWIAADVTRWTPPRIYKLWHDRAVFHFLTDPLDRAAYLAALLKGVAPDGCVVISTFAPEGPEKCSGLPVVRYSAQSLTAELGPQFELVETRSEAHTTPWHSEQHFQFSRFKRR
jgi:2-polyprenyl-3-methyl-5-hydroxy-6-metoxy-1,4-benzoquinol methylase